MIRIRGKFRFSDAFDCSRGAFHGRQGIDPCRPGTGPEFDFAERPEPGLFEIAETEIEQRPALFLEQIQSISSPEIFVEILHGLPGEKFTRIDTAGLQSSCKFGGEIEICSRLAFWVIDRIGVADDLRRGLQETSSSSAPSSGSTISATSEVGVIMCDATARKSSELRAAKTLRVLG